MKYGDFIGKVSLGFDDATKLKMSERIQRAAKKVFRLNDKVEVEDRTTYILVKVPLKLSKIKNGRDTIYDITELKLLCDNESGTLNGKEMTQFSINAFTNGKYHEYRHQYKNDFTYEGADHYMYDTEIEDIGKEVEHWMENVKVGKLR